MGLRKHVLGGMPICATWRTRLNHPCAVAMRPFVKLLLPLLIVVVVAAAAAAAKTSRDFAENAEVARVDSSFSGRWTH